MKIRDFIILLFVFAVIIMTIFIVSGKKKEINYVDYNNSNSEEMPFNEDEDTILNEDDEFSEHNLDEDSLIFEKEYETPIMKD